MFGQARLPEQWQWIHVLAAGIPREICMRYAAGMTSACTPTGITPTRYSWFLISWATPMSMFVLSNDLISRRTHTEFVRQQAKPSLVIAMDDRLI
ncbi:MAG: hypothetical protein ACXWCP_22745 [Burkholderiales bacterium]